MTKGCNEVYFHEDDYCQQEVLPLTALDFCSKQIKEIDEFAVAHLAPGGADIPMSSRERIHLRSLLKLKFRLSRSELH
jgi:hypothetical protein